MQPWKLIDCSASAYASGALRVRYFDGRHKRDYQEEFDSAQPFLLKI
jgi:hypothetical protein